MALPTLLGPALLLFLTVILPPLIWATLRTIGMGLVSYIGLDITMTNLRDYIFTTYSGLPSELISIMGIAGVDIAIKIIMTSYVVAFSVRHTVSGIKRLIFLD